MVAHSCVIKHINAPEEVPVVDFPTTKPTKVEVTVPTDDHVTGVLHLLNLIMTPRTLFCVFLDFYFYSLILFCQLLHLDRHLLVCLLTGLSLVPRLSTAVTELPPTPLLMANKVLLHYIRLDRRRCVDTGKGAVRGQTVADIGGCG